MDEIDQRTGAAAFGEGDAGPLRPAPARYAGGAGPGGGDGLHRITANNRFSRVTLGFSGLRPGAWACLTFGLAFDAGEAAALAVDCAAAGFDFLAADGSSLDLDHVPGLARSLLDPQVAWIPGPALLGVEGAAAFRIAFRVPEQAAGLVVTLRSWRNSGDVTLADPVLGFGEADGGPGPRRRSLMGAGVRLRYALAEDMALVLRGQIHAARAEEHAARVRLSYRDAAGTEIAPPYANAVSVPGLGAVINLSARPQARRFTLTLRPPPGAASVELAFGPWEDVETPPEAELMGATELAFEDAFRLESLCDEDLLDARAFLARVAGRLGLPEDASAAWLMRAGASVAPILAKARALRMGPDRSARLDGGSVVLSLAGLPDWTLPAAPDWREDPFRSVAWRLAYQSLSWLLPLAALPEGSARAGTLAAAWSRANPWGQPADGLSLHPAALAPRSEVLAHLVTGADAASGTEIAAEAARHGFAVAEIVGQNTLARALPGLQAAAALLAVARALPSLPFAAHWDSLARDSLAQGFDALLPEDGAFAEAAPVRRLDLLSHGQVLAAALGETEPGPTLRRRVEAALPGLAGLLDPGGRLPPFGDAPAGFDHAAWIARLASSQGGGTGRELTAERETVPASDGRTADMLALRYDGPERGWGHFALTHAAQSPHGHRDCTSFTFATGARRWIVEGGGADGAEVGPARHYLLSPRAHNVAIPDRREPVAGTGRLTARLALDGAQAFVLSTTIHGPDYAHARLFLALDDLSGLAVIDRFSRPGRSVSFEGLLHLSPEALVALTAPCRALAQQDGRRLAFLAVALKGQPAGMEVAIGRNDRAQAMQGFMATGSGGLKPAPVLAYAFSGRDVVCGGAVAAADAEAERRLVRMLADGAVRRLVEG
ncbi:MAG: heparinase II/III family protein [Methylorubrum populi]